MNTYVFDQGWQKERDRLAGIESLFDRYSTQRLADLGVREGWHCLEVGFGAGGVALWLAGQVGSAGRVVATDLDPRFLAGHGRANLDVRKHDIVTDPLEEAAFDLAHARAVLDHIPDRQSALARMISAVRPGGWLVLEAGDFGGVMAAAMAHYVDPPGYAPSYERAVRALENILTAAGGDANFGARLVRMFTDAGLVNIAAEARTPLVAGGTENWVHGSVEQLAEQMVSTGLVTVSDIESVLAMTADRSCRYAPPPMVTAWGQRPVSGTMPCLQFRPDDLAGPVGHALPVPAGAHRLDQHQAAAALVLGARVARRGGARDAVPDFDQQLDAVAGHPQDHDGHPGAVVPGTVVGSCRGPDGVRDQLTDDELGGFGQVGQAPFGQHSPGVQAGARGCAGQGAERQGRRQRP
jgi:SAM-dependent methyltransferase